MSRMIDADALIDGYRHMGYDPSEHPEESYMAGWCKGFNSAVDHCIHHVIHAPTIEPERKRGKWNTYYHGDTDFSHSCNQCGYSAPYQMIGGEVFQKKWNFCPNCGADMRGEQDG